MPIDKKLLEELLAANEDYDPEEARCFNASLPTLLDITEGRTIAVSIHRLPESEDAKSEGDEGG